MQQQPSPYPLPPYQPGMAVNKPNRTRLILFVVLGLVGAMVALCVVGFAVLYVIGSSAQTPGSPAHATAQAATAVALNGDEQRLQASSEELFNETFDSNEAGFDTTPTNDSTVTIDGAYQATLNESAYRSIYSKRELSSVITEVDCKVLQGGSNGVCGIILGVHEVDGSENNDELFLYVTGNSYGVRTRVGNVNTNKSFSVAAVKSEDGAVNHLRVVRVDNEARLYVNGQLIDRVEVSNDKLKAGSVGFSVGAENGKAVVEVDNWKVSEIK